MDIFPVLCSPPGPRSDRWKKCYQEWLKTFKREVRPIDHSNATSATSVGYKNGQILWTCTFTLQAKEQWADEWGGKLTVFHYLQRHTPPIYIGKFSPLRGDLSYLPLSELLSDLQEEHTLSPFHFCYKGVHKI